MMSLGSEIESPAHALLLRQDHIEEPAVIVNSASLHTPAWL